MREIEKLNIQDRAEAAGHNKMHGFKIRQYLLKNHSAD